MKRVMKAEGGKFKQTNDPFVASKNENDTDVAELALAARERVDEDSSEESNEEGMGDIDVAESGI